MNIMTPISADCASPISLPPEVDYKRKNLASAFLDLEPSVCDLSRLALLAERELHGAVGDLKHENGVCVDAPDAEALELAVLVVSLLVEKVRELQGEWYRLHDAAS